MPRRILASFAYSAVLGWTGSAFALDPTLDVSQYLHSSWKSRDGFLQSYINAMAQTPDGYLWLGTVSGLLRFDGVRAVQWQPPSGERLPDEDVLFLFAASDGRLWIGTRKGLASWKNDRLSHYPDLDGLTISGLTETRNGTIWVSAASPDAGRLCSFRADETHCEDRAATLDVDVLGYESIYADAVGNLWLGQKNVLMRWKPHPTERYELTGNLLGFAEDPDRDEALLVATDHGILRVEGDRSEPYPLPAWVPPFTPVKMLRDRDGGLWIAALDGGLVHVHRGKVDLFRQSDGLSGNRTLALLEDREGSIWVASMEGLDRFRDPGVVTISMKQGLSSSSVASVLASRDGSLWVGTYHGLNRWKDGQFTIYRGPLRASQSSVEKGPLRPNVAAPAAGTISDKALPDDRITSLFEDNRGRVWVATYGGALGYFAQELFVPVPGLAPRNWVFGFAENEDGLWISSQKGGLGLFTRDAVKPVNMAVFGQKRQLVSSLVGDRLTGGIWLGFEQGGVIFYKDRQVRSRFTVKDGLGDGWVFDLQSDGDGGVWAATQGGLSRVKNGRVVTLTTQNGLPCNSVEWLTQDDDRAFWLFLPCGLVRISASEINAWIADPKRKTAVTIFDAVDGVRLVPYPSGAHPAVAKTADGKLWFEQVDGVGVLDPKHLPFNRLPPPVNIEKIVASRQSYQPASRVQLPPLPRDLEIEYTALSLVAPEKVQFRYKLEGHDRDWQNVGNRRQAFYNDLPPGNYRFRVIASNNSGVWNEKGASLDFSIAPAYWQTAWFRALCVVAILAFLWILYWLRLRQLAREFDLKLESRVDERTRIARELHDTLLQSFNAALVRFRTAQRLLLNRPDEGREVLEGAIDDAREALSEGRQAVQGLRSSVVETNELSEAIRRLAQELASEPAHAGGGEVRLNIEGTPRALRPLIRDDIYRLVGEALRNAFRHAQASHIEVQLVYDARRFELRVRDDGKGIDPKHLREGGLPGHFGLPGMRERAQRIGGKFTVWSAPDSGTEIAVSIPGGRAYAERERRSWLARKILRDREDAESP